MEKNYEEVFSIGENGQVEKEKGMLKKLVKLNLGHILLNCLVYLFQALPIWVMPIVTSNVINIISKVIASPLGLTDGLRNELIINLVVLAVSILQNVPSTMLRWKIASTATRRTSAGIRCALVKKLQALSFLYKKDLHTGKIQAKFLKDLEAIDLFFWNFMHVVIPNIVNVIVATIISVYSNVYVALFFAVVIPINVVVTWAFRKKLKNKNKDYRLENEEMSAKMSAMLEMLPVTKAHGLEETEKQKMDKSIFKLAKAGRNVDSATASFGSWVWVINTLLNAGCLAFCIILAVNKIIDIGEVVLYQSMFTSISSGVNSLVGIVPQLTSGIDALDSVSEIMTSKEVEISINKPKISSLKGEVEFKGVGFTYPNTTEKAVDNFSLKVKSGECVAFVGASGSGKTTVMNMITGLIKINEGQILIDGKDIFEYNLQELRHYVSVVPQGSILFSGTIRENITYGLADYTEEDLAEAIRKANIEEFLKDLPYGLDTEIGEHGDKLSGGQKQRITIARALIRDPKILILDEATSALDNISEYHVQQAIKESVKGRTTFIVAHRLSTIRDANKIVVMENGRIVEIGTYEELMAKKSKFFELKNLNELSLSKMQEIL